jgi:hypothetical protein
MAMVRTGIAGGGTTPMRLVYSTRTPDTLLYGDELRRLAEHQPQVDVELRYTRRAPEGWSGPVGRLDAARLAALAWPPADRPAGLCAAPPGSWRPSPTCWSIRGTRQSRSRPNGSDQPGVDGGSDDRLEHVDRRQHARRPAPRHLPP